VEPSGLRYQLTIGAPSEGPPPSRQRSRFQLLKAIIAAFIAFSVGMALLIAAIVLGSVLAALIIIVVFIVVAAYFFSRLWRRWAGRAKRERYM
jgi:uncharacterized membrane protein